jgi:hypothetical protein
VTSPVPLARHPVSIAGALAIAAAFELFHNPYAGLVVFVAPPAAHADSLTLRCSVSQSISVVHNRTMTILLVPRAAKAAADTSRDTVPDEAHRCRASAV